MSNELQGIWTQYGKERDAAARAGGDKLNITHAAVGSGLGAVPVVSPAQTALKKEVWRGPVNGVQINPEDPTDVIVDVVLPNDIGGFWIREWGLFDDAGKLVALGPHSEMHKPVIASGQAAEMLERFHLPAKDAGAINLTIASQALATQNYVKSKIDAHNADIAAHDFLVPKIRRVNTTLPLLGGGELSGNLNLGVELATLAEVLAGVDATKVVTPATLRGAFKFGSAWFQIGLDGPIVQFGTTSNWDATISPRVVVTLPIAFPVNAHVAFCIDYNNDYGGSITRQAVWVWGGANNKTQVAFESNAASISGAVWVAIGR